MKAASQLERIGIPQRTGIANAVDFMGGGVWRLWLHTPDYVHGTFLLLYSDGRATRVVCREDEGDDEFIVRPSYGYNATTEEE